MRRLCFITIALCLCSWALFPQGKKATIMILPSDNWCVSRYYTTTYQDDGRRVIVPDYRRAFQEDLEIGSVISQVGQRMINLGYSLKDAEQELKSIEQHKVEDDVMTSKGGSAIGESPLDILKRRSRSDIIIQVGWQISNSMEGAVVNTTIEAFDAYTSKRIATSSGFSKVLESSLQESIVEGMVSNISSFDKQLERFFSELSVSGREIILTVRRWASWENDLETDYDGEELLDVIQKWMSQNTVGGNFNLSDASENFALFEQVRIPLQTKNGIAMDARSFATELRKYLQKSPYNITSKVLTRGLGEAIVVLGEK